MATNTTSLDAHNHVFANKDVVRLELLAFIGEQGTHGALADEVAAEWNCGHNHVLLKLMDLCRDGRLMPSGRRRETRSGRSAAVLVLPAQHRNPTDRNDSHTGLPKLSSSFFFDDLTPNPNWRDPEGFS